MIRYIYIVILLIFGALHVQSQNESVDATTPIILILDGSGSMWGQIQGKTKIEIARKVTGDLLSKLDPSRPVGLVVYGHRQKGSCDDIQRLVEPGVNNRDKILDALSRINPVGKTPLANTAIMVIEHLKSDNSSATVILISDGAESCGGDLCEVVRLAKEAKVDFVLHIVGFDIGESDKLALECAAKAGQGVYLDASNAEELGAALDQAARETVPSLPPSLSVKVTKDGQFHDATVQIFRPEDTQYIDSRRAYGQKEGNPALFGLSNGTYQIKVIPIGSDVSEIWKKDVLISSDELKEIEIDFTAGQLSILTTANNEKWDCVVNITNTSENKSVAGGRTYKSINSNPMIKELNPGIYDVKISAMKLSGASTTKVFERVEVKAGETTSLEHNFEYGELSVFASNNGKLWDCVVNTFVAGDPRKRSVAGGRTYKSSSHNPFSDLLTPGKYSVEYRAHYIHGPGWKYVLKDLDVKVGEKTKAEYDYETGIARIGATYKGEPWTSNVTLYKDGTSVYSKRASGNYNPREIVLTPGTYEVQVTSVRLNGESEKFTINIVKGVEIEKMVEYD